MRLAASQQIQQLIVDKCQPMARQIQVRRGRMVAGKQPARQIHRRQRANIRGGGRGAYLLIDQASADATPELSSPPNESSD